MVVVEAVGNQFHVGHTPLLCSVQPNPCPLMLHDLKGSQSLLAVQPVVLETLGCL